MNYTCISPRPRSTRTEQKEKDLGKYRGPWQEDEVGNDPAGRNARRAAGDGDPARAEGVVLGQEREIDGVGKRDEWVWGSWNSPCPALNPHSLATMR